MPGAGHRFLPAILTTLVAVPAACASDGAGPISDAPAGLEISLNGSTVVRVSGDEVQGLLHLHVDEYSGRFIITPVTEDGRAVPDAARYVLEATVGNTDVVTFVAAKPGAFEGEFVAYADGGTTITFAIMGTDSTTVAYRTPPIDIVATTCIYGVMGQSVGC